MEILTFCTSFNQWNHSIKFRPVCFLVIGWGQNFHRSGERWKKLKWSQVKQKNEFLKLFKLNIQNNNETKRQEQLEFKSSIFCRIWTIALDYLISWDHSKFFVVRWYYCNFDLLYFFQPMKSQYQILPICFLVIGWSQNLHSTSLPWKKLKWSQVKQENEILKLFKINIQTTMTHTKKAFEIQTLNFLSNLDLWTIK